MLRTKCSPNVDKFWDLHLKATVYRKIDFGEQKQQFCAGLPEDMNKYVNSQRPKTISAVIHHTMVAAKINFQQGAKRNLKPMEIKEKHEHKGKNQPPNSSKGNSSNNKAKEKGVYKGKNRLTPEELERYRKDNRCFKCGEQGHAYRACPQRNARNEQPRASIIEAPKEDVHCKGSPLSYAWGKVREHDALILFDPGSTHNFISHELAAKLGIQDFEMGDAMKADGAFVGQDASVTPLIGKLRLHIQGYMDKEDFFISPLKHEDVILGAPWFDRLAASIKFPERRISFKFREKNIYNKRQEDFPTLRAYNDYLEEVEDMIFNLIDGVNVQAIEEKIKIYQEQNADQIIASNARKVEERSAAHRKQNVQQSSVSTEVASEQAQPFAQAPSGIYAPAVAPGSTFMQPKPAVLSSHDREGLAEDEETKKLRKERGARAGGWTPELGRRRAFEEAFSSLWVN
ncbi:hypothetical protein L7F22_057525 [Adiantum nelumboides]|nr:hypothetical protein [Adiantum nelumboides]